MLIRAELIAIIALGSGTVLNGAVKFGNRPPEIHFDNVVPDHRVANARFSRLAGKAAVVEMWGDTVRACISAIPRLNALAQQFKDRAVWRHS